MDPEEHVSLEKKSLFSSVWIFTNENGGRVGTFRERRRFGYFRGEGEVGGATLSLAYGGWGTSRGEVRDEWGRVIGTMFRFSWCGRSAQILLYEKEYVWRTDSAGSVFTIRLSDGTELVRIVGSAGFGTHGTMQILAPLEKTEALLLTYMGLFQQRAFEAEVALSTAVMSILILFGSTFLL